MDKSLEKTIQNLIGEQYSPNSEEYKFVVSSLCEDFWQVYNVDGFFELDVDTICGILSNKDLRVSTSLDTFKVALKWIAFISSQRWQYTEKVMNCVRFRAMTYTELQQCYEIVGSLEKYQSREIFQRVKNSITSAIREQVVGVLGESRTCSPERQLQPQETALSSFANGFIGRIRKWLGYSIKSTEEEKTEKKWKETGRRIFGLSLDHLMDNTPYGTVLPFVVTRICEYIRSKGFDHADLFSSNFDVDDLEALTEEFDTYGDGELEETSIATVGQLLLRFFADMNRPVIPQHVYGKLTIAQGTYKKNVPKYTFHLRQAMNALERDNYVLVKYIIRFLVEVANSSKKSPTVLADAFAPTLFGCPRSFHPLVVSRIVVDLMEHHAAVFEDENPSIFKLSPDPSSTWFHGTLPQKHAHRLLKNNGDFLVRKKINKTSEPKYIVSMQCRKGTKDFEVRRRYYGWQLNGEIFPTITELVQYHVNTGQSVSKNSKAVLKRAVKYKEDKFTLEVLPMSPAVKHQSTFLLP